LLSIAVRDSSTIKDVTSAEKNRECVTNSPESFIAIQKTLKLA
jgi:hypothetical protein